MRLTSSPIFEIVRLIDLQPEGETGFCMLVDPPVETNFIAELRAELELQTGVTLGVIAVIEMAVNDLIERLRTAANLVMLIDGLGSWTDAQFGSLDVNRSRLDTGGFLLFRVDLKTAGRFLDSAPNIRSFIGTNIFQIAPDPSLMNPEEIAERLDQLRTYYRLSDTQVIERAANGALPADPEFVEWLVLLGRSELVR